jgi:hypothetical protein
MTYLNPRRRAASNGSKLCGPNGAAGLKKRPAANKG